MEEGPAGSEDLPRCAVRVIAQGGASVSEIVSRAAAALVALPGFRGGRIAGAGAGWSAGELGPDAARADADGVTVEVAGVTPDAEALTALARWLAVAVARERLADEARRRLHDVRGALAVVTGQGEMLGEGLLGPMTPRQAHAVAVIMRQADRLDESVDGLKSVIGEFTGLPPNPPSEGR